MFGFLTRVDEVIWPPKGDSSADSFTVAKLPYQPSIRYIKPRGRLFHPISKHREVSWKNETQPQYFLVKQLLAVWK